MKSKKDIYQEEILTLIGEILDVLTSNNYRTGMAVVVSLVALIVALVALKGG